MKTFGAFGRTVKTRQGFFISVGGLCRVGEERLWQERCTALKKLYLEDLELYDADYMLAMAARDLFDRTVPLVGLSLFMPSWKYGATGGVLGNPHAVIRSSEEGFERLPCGMLLFSRPCGPGYATDLNEDKASLFHTDFLKLQLPERKEKFFDLIEAAGAHHAVAVWDGSGSSTAGAVLILAGKTRVSEYPKSKRN